MSSVSEQATGSIRPAENVDPAIVDIGSALGAEIVEFEPPVAGHHDAGAELASWVASSWQNNIPFSLHTYNAKEVRDVSMVAGSRAGARQEAAVNALTGEIPITGRLPIDLPARLWCGHGVVVPGLTGVMTLPRGNP